MYIVILCGIYLFLRRKSKYFVKIVVYLYRGNNTRLRGITPLIFHGELLLAGMFVGLLPYDREALVFVECQGLRVFRVNI